VGLLLLDVVLTVVCLHAGYAGMTPWEVLKAFLGVGDKTNRVILWNIRMPRVLAAAVAGAGLAMAGCVMQTVLKNPMASPSTLGVSQAAVFGANFAIIVLGAGAFHSTHGEAVSISNPYLVTGCAFLCALGSTLLILLLSGRQGFSPETVVLAGVAVGSIFSAGTTLIQSFALDTQVAAAVFWTFGDLGRATYQKDLIISIVVGLSFVFFMVNRWNYQALDSGEVCARSLGVRTGPVRFATLLLSSLICAVCVSFLGIIGFVGLVAPQAVKRFLGSDHRFLLPGSALCGAALLLFADTLSRSLMAGVSLPVGAITSLFGGPMFLWMLLRKKKGGSV
jgi:iron complex transport system permease protein